MTQEERQLLLKDLSARLLYETWVKYEGKEWLVTGYGHGRVSLLPSVFSSIGGPCPLVEEVRPYLRPMSSMTEEELKELNEKYGNIAYFFMQEPPYYHGLQAQHSDIGSIEISEFSEIYDWLNVHHFDYRGLIEKGLALEAHAGMYKTE